MLRSMNHHRVFPRLLAFPWLLTAALALGCAGEPPSQPSPPAKSAKEPTAKAKSEPKKVQAGKSVWLEIQDGRRRVVIEAAVCLREGQLEQLLCRKQTKEHEAILAADVDARDIHKALLAAGAKPGSTVRYQPTYQPPTGSRIKITLRYDKNGQTVTVPAREWILNSRTKKDLDHDWVFAGSQFVENSQEKDKPPFYTANSGDVICVSNFETAMLDLPINSPKDNSDLSFEAHTGRIPPMGTKVLVILEPVAAKK